jgi:hypothetical protein
VPFVPNAARAYPELIRHGYVHCTACHVSPAGGGLTTAYGRSLSKELLSRWAYEGEESLFHGLLNGSKVAAWVNSEVDSGLFIGGDVRVIQTHQENEFQRKRRAFPMQMDFEAAYRGKWGSAGLTYGVEKRGEEKTYTLRRWALISPVVENIWIRVAMGTPHFALMTSEHNWAFRQDLGFGPLDRRHLGEVEYQGETWGALLGSAKSDDTLNSAARETSTYGTLDVLVNNNKKIGLDVWRGTFEGTERWLRGAHAALGWNEHVTTLAQFTVQNRKSVGTEQQSWYLFQKTSWEPTKGLWLSGIIDVAQFDQANEKARREKYGPGLQFFPRPHLELQLAYLRVKDLLTSEKEGDEAFLILHYYL